jgi:hypothetical protein
MGADKKAKNGYIAPSSPYSLGPPPRFFTTKGRIGKMILNPTMLTKVSRMTAKVF